MKHNLVLVSLLICIFINAHHHDFIAALIGFVAFVVILKDFQVYGDKKDAEKAFMRGIVDKYHFRLSNKRLVIGFILTLITVGMTMAKLIN